MEKLKCLSCCVECYSVFHLQRATNLENSTYDLYSIPKESDSQNPDGKKDAYYSRLFCFCILLIVNL